LIHFYKRNMYPRHKNKQKMAKKRPLAPVQDKTPAQLKNSLSHKRNQASVRLIKQIKNHQQATGFKVLVNFIPTWYRGKSYNWKSKNWGATNPVLRNQKQDESSGSDEGSELDTDSDESESGSDVVRAPIARRMKMATDSESDTLPDSQDLQVKPRAVSDETKKTDMKIMCIRCFKAKKSTDKVGTWLRCGYKGCSRLYMHTRCNFIHLPHIKTSSNLLKFCREYIRCSEHTGKFAMPPVALPDLVSNDGESSDDVFTSTLKKKTQKTIEKPKKLPKKSAASKIFKKIQTPKKVPTKQQLSVPDFIESSEPLIDASGDHNDPILQDDVIERNERPNSGSSQKPAPNSGSSPKPTPLKSSKKPVPIKSTKKKYSPLISYENPAPLQSSMNTSPSQIYFKRSPSKPSSQLPKEPTSKQPPKSISIQSPKPGSIQSPKPGSIQSPKPGSIQSPQSGSIQSPRPGSIKSPKPGSIKSIKPASRKSFKPASNKSLTQSVKSSSSKSSKVKASNNNTKKKKNIFLTNSLFEHDSFDDDDDEFFVK